MRGKISAAIKQKAIAEIVEFVIPARSDQKFWFSMASFYPLHQFLCTITRESTNVSFQWTDNQENPRMRIKISIRWYTSVPFTEIRVRQWTRLWCGHCFPQLSAAANLSYPAGSSDQRRPQFLRSASGYICVKPNPLALRGVAYEQIQQIFIKDSIQEQMFPYRKYLRETIKISSNQNGAVQRRWCLSRYSPGVTPVMVWNTLVK